MQDFDEKSKEYLYYFIFFRQKIGVCTLVRNNRSSIFIRDKNVNSEGTHPAGEGACRK